MSYADDMMQAQLLTGIMQQPGMMPSGVSNAMRGMLNPSPAPQQGAIQPSMAQRYADAIRATIKGGGQTTIMDQLRGGAPSIGWPPLP